MVVSGVDREHSSAGAYDMLMSSVSFVGFFLSWLPSTAAGKHP